MITMYCVQGAVDGKQLPTFYLCPDVQGIMTPVHALKIANEIVNPNKDTNLNLGLYVQKVQLREDGESVWA